MHKSNINKKELYLIICTVNQAEKKKKKKKEYPMIFSQQILAESSEGY